jgi:hypothetical protein
MNDNFERRRANRAVLMVMGIAFAAIALNDGIHALTTSAVKRAPARTSSQRLERCDDSTGPAASVSDR